MCPGQRGDPDRLGAGREQSVRAGARRRACGENVVDDERMFALHRAGVGDAEGSANILTALSRREASLALGCAQPYQRVWSQSQSPLRMRRMQGRDGLSCQQPRLIEAAV